MRTLLMTAFGLALAILATQPAMAENFFFGFDDGTHQNVVRTSCLEEHCTGFYALDNNEGHPAAGWAFHGNWGFAFQSTRPEMTGDLKAKNIHQIAVDLKIRSWYPQGNEATIQPLFFIKGTNHSDIWYAPAQGFLPVTGQWLHLTVEIDPNWSDAEAMQHGWAFRGAAPVSFQQVLQNVYAVGLSVDIPDRGAESHGWIDNIGVSTAVPGSPVLKNKPALIHKEELKKPAINPKLLKTPPIKK